MTQEQITDTNCIICGDCRDQLARIPDGSVDLIYLDPPFFSGKNYEIIWGDGSEIRGFEDAQFYKVVCECGEEFPAHHKICSECGASYKDAVKRRPNEIKVYIDWLRPRLEECKRVLSDTGSIYCHLDWHAVHYVKVMMDDIFGYDNLRSEIIWRIGWLSGFKTQKKGWIRNHDTILYYIKSNEYTFNKEYISYPEDYVRRDGKKPTGKGLAIEDTWNCTPLDTLNSINIMSFSKEKMGYPTQKSEALLERIIKASSNPGDVVLDPFCGCGTAVTVAQKLGRKWIGIDVSPTSTRLMVKRLKQPYKDDNGKKIPGVKIDDNDIIDLPRTCKELIDMSPFEFRNLVMRELDGKINDKKSDVNPIDGWTYKKDEFGMGYKIRGFDAIVQINQMKSRTERPDIAGFPDVMREDKFTDGKHGIIVALNFTKAEKKYVDTLKVKSDKSIVLITVKELFNCGDK